MKSIIFINRFFYPDHSATSQILTDLAFYLSKKNWQVKVICSRQGYDASGKQLEKYEKVNGVDIYRISTTEFGRNWLPGRVFDYISYFAGMCWRLKSLADKDCIIVVKTDPPLTSVLTILIANWKSAKHVCWVQDLFPEVAEALNVKLFPKFISFGLKKLRNWSFNKSDQIVVIGEKMRKHLESEKVSSIINVVPNWSDGKNVFPVAKEENILRETWGLQSKFIVGYSGNMGRVHEFDTILDAAKKLMENEEVIFVFIGGGPKKQYIKQQIKRQGIGNVFFFPYQDYNKLNISLSLPDVHLISLQPSIEGFCVPSKYYGVIAAGRPVIFVGDSKGEIAQHVQHDNVGYTVEVGNSCELADRILKLYQHPQLQREFGKNARGALNLNFDKSHALLSWENLLKQVF